MQLIPYGENAILLVFTQSIDPATSRLVQIWEQRIRSAKLPGLSHFIPAYASLTIIFEQIIREPENIIAQIRQLAETTTDAPTQTERQLRIPVCYESAYALDQQAVMEHLQLDWHDIIQLHIQTTFQVYMLGFSPGFAFMGPLPAALQIPRRATPRLKVPARSVGLAGAQTGIYPDELPGGWQLIGRSPIHPFRPAQNNPFLFLPGDQVQFYAINSEQYESLDTQIRTQQFDWHTLINPGSRHDTTNN